MNLKKSMEETLREVMEKRNIIIKTQTQKQTTNQKCCIRLVFILRLNYSEDNILFWKIN